MDNLFVLKDFISHSGLKLNFKIECDMLTNTDIKTIAVIITEKYDFCDVVGIPTGGSRLYNELKKYVSKESNTLLIVDDVLTTGESMQREREKYNTPLQIQGVVIFARAKCPEWIDPIFQLWEEIMK